MIGKECHKHGYFYMFIMQVQVKNNACRCYSVTCIKYCVYLRKKCIKKSVHRGMLTRILSPT